MSAVTSHCRISARGRPARGWRALLATEAPRATILVRAMVGIVFVSEGIQKFLYADALGAGRFAKIGIPAPELMGPFVGGVEGLCGALILAGLLTRLAAVPLIIDMVVAIASTKLPMLLGQGYLWFAGPPSDKTGLWSMLHESRTDLSMLLGSTFLLIVGAGAVSVDVRWLDAMLLDAKSLEAKSLEAGRRRE